MKGPNIAKLAAVFLIGTALCFGGSMAKIDGAAEAQKIKKNSDWEKKDSRSGSSAKSKSSSSSGAIKKDSGSSSKSSGSSSSSSRVRKDDSWSKRDSSSSSSAQKREREDYTPPHQSARTDDRPNSTGIRKNDSWDKRDSSSSSSGAKRERADKAPPRYDSRPNDSPSSVRIRRDNSQGPGGWERGDADRSGRDGRDNGYSKPGRPQWQPRKPDFTSPGKGGTGDTKKIRVTHKYRGPKYIYVVGRCGSPWWYYDWDPWWRRHRSSFGIYFYYGSYSCDPYPLEFWSFPSGRFPSIYCFYRTAPTWILRTPLIVINNFIDYDDDYRRYRHHYSQAYHYGDGLRDCIDDIRRSWLTGDPDYMTSRLDDWRDIRVYFDSRYCYSMPSQDYYEMTLDTITMTRTLDFDLLRSFERRSGEVFCVFRHTYEDWDGTRRSVYLSYLLRKINGWWRIVAVGSSESPIYGMPDRW